MGKETLSLMIPEILRSFRNQNVCLIKENTSSDDLMSYIVVSLTKIVTFLRTCYCRLRQYKK